jgi:hypothetical protein
MSVVEHATIDPPVIKSRGGRPRAEVRSTYVGVWPRAADSHSASQQDG